MTKLVNALRQKDTVTENGMVTNSSSLNNCVDLFFQIGAMRGKGKNTVISAFSKAFNENPLVALRLLFWVRDIRGGAGERQIFRDILKDYLANDYTEMVVKNTHLISEFGRWDDVLVLIGTSAESKALDLIVEALGKKDGLCAKWMPRKGSVANTIRKRMGLTPKEYRKTLVELTHVVETAMCSKKFDSINYEHVPSLAMSRYLKAFGRNDATRFGEYIKKLEKGEVKINAGALYPYDVIKSLRFDGNAKACQGQWDALPNYLEGNESERILPMCDVSGSMSCAAGGNANLTCMDVCLSLGLYISERNEGPFKDAFLTFSARPALQYLNGPLKDRLNQLQRAQWDMNTDLEKAFDVLLAQAVKHNVPANEMPTMILILSDMEFDQASDYNSTAQEMIRAKYVAAGYELPKIVYWNLNARNSNFPVRFNEEGTALVSGFSPSILKNLLAGKDMTPESIMLDVVNSERYAPVQI